VYDDGRNQLDVINDVLNALDDHDIVQLQGAVGTGKSNIALHVISEKKKGIISVPTKILEEQYVDDYCGDGVYKIVTRLDMSMDVNNLRGRTNFPCLNPPRHIKDTLVTCGHEALYCTRPLIEPETRAEVAQACLHWSPVYSPTMLPEAFNSYNMKTFKYDSISGSKIYFEAKKPCPYYAQFIHFVPEGAIIMNSSKWEAETWIGRKPRVPVEIIDEADMFLDSLSYKTSLSNWDISKIEKARIFDEQETSYAEREIGQLYQKYRGKPEMELTTAPDLESFVNGICMAIEGSSEPTLATLSFKLDVLLKFKEYVYFVAIDARNITGFMFFIARLDITLNELRKRSGKIVLMSATAHSPENLQNIFNIAPPKIIAQDDNPGTLYLMTPADYKLPKITHRTWDKLQIQQEYHRILEHQLRVATKPCYVLVHAMRYLPNAYKRNNDESRDTYWKRSKHKGVRFSTRMDRGIDLKDDQCRSIILLKYPIPNISDVLKKAQRKLLGETVFWKYINDMADRDLLQQCGRAIRHKDDWCQIYSPDRKSVNRLRQIWKGRLQATKYN